jgi:hypothetical protein
MSKSQISDFLQILTFPPTWNAMVITCKNSVSQIFFGTIFKGR